ncbi:MAG: LacI family DNA-binding transcriptional regulator [Blautia sp.]
MNIYDIAKLAGVSIATVSRVVNDSPKVSEKTKEKVRAVMAANDYIPNVFARGMSLNSMKTVGIICPSVSDHYMASAVAYLEKNLRNYGYDCILYCSGYDQEDKEISVQMILQKRIDALLLVGSCYAGDKEYGEDITYIKKASEEIPVFIMNGFIDGENIYCMLTDDYQSVFDAVSAMIASGRKQILFLSDSYSYSAMHKLQGMRMSSCAAFRCWGSARSTSKMRFIWCGTFCWPEEIWCLTASLPQMTVWQWAQ